MAQNNSITSLLKQDHQAVMSILRELQDDCRKGNVDERKLDKLCNDLSKHMQFEETALYPEVEKERIAPDLIQDAYDEHGHMKEDLNELAPGRTASELRPVLDKLHEELTHHVREEENKLFPKLENNWDRERLARMGQAFSDMKEKEVTR